MGYFPLNPQSRGSLSDVHSAYLSLRPSLSRAWPLLLPAAWASVREACLSMLLEAEVETLFSCEHKRLTCCIWSHVPGCYPPPPPPTPPPPTPTPPPNGIGSSASLWEALDLKCFLLLLGPRVDPQQPAGSLHLPAFPMSVKRPDRRQRFSGVLPSSARRAHGLQAHVFGSRASLLNRPVSLCLPLNPGEPL